MNHINFANEGELKWNMTFSFVMLQKTKALLNH